MRAENQPDFGNLYAANLLPEWLLKDESPLAGEARELWGRGVHDLAHPEARRMAGKNGQPPHSAGHNHGRESPADSKLLFELGGHIFHRATQ
jgi:hypothetical protein